MSIVDVTNKDWKPGYKVFIVDKGLWGEQKLVQTRPNVIIQKLSDDGEEIIYETFEDAAAAAERVRAILGENYHVVPTHDKYSRDMSKVINDSFWAGQDGFTSCS